MAERAVALAAPYLAADRFRHRPTRAGSPAEVVLARWLEALVRKLQRLCGIELPAGHIVATAEPAGLPGGDPLRRRGAGPPGAENRPCPALRRLGSTAYDFAAALRELQAWANRLCLGPSTRAIVEAARSRGIPVRRLNVASLVQFGHGAQQRRICTAETDGTGAIAESIAQDKELTKTLLRRVGIPVPEGRPVTSAADAWEAAVEVGTPVVVKPRDANHGRGVAIRLSTREAVMNVVRDRRRRRRRRRDRRTIRARASNTACWSSAIGWWRCRAASPTWSSATAGIRSASWSIWPISIRVGATNSPGRCARSRSTRCRESLLEQQGYAADSIPAGRRPGDHSSTTANTRPTSPISCIPKSPSLAVLAARVVGLDVAGIDLVTPDISRPLEPRRGMIIEVNAGPGLQMHAEPQIGRPRPGRRRDHRNAVSRRTDRPHSDRRPWPKHPAPPPPPWPRPICWAAPAGTSDWPRRPARGSAAGFLGSHPGRPNCRRFAAQSLRRGGRVRSLGRRRLHRGPGLRRLRRGRDAASGSRRRPTLPDETETWRRILVESVSPLGTAIFEAADPRARRLAACCRGEVLFCHPRPPHPLLVAQRAAGQQDRLLARRRDLGRLSAIAKWRSPPPATLIRRPTA